MPRLDPKLSEDILAAVDAGIDGQLAYTADLVRFPSHCGQEQIAQDFVFDSLSSVKRVTGTIALFIAEWCGLEKLRKG